MDLAGEFFSMLTSRLSDLWLSDRDEDLVPQGQWAER